MECCDSSKREGKIWKYQEVALHVDFRDRITAEWGGTAHMGKSIAISNATKNEAKNIGCQYIYIDSHAVFKG